MDTTNLKYNKEMQIQKDKNPQKHKKSTKEIKFEIKLDPKFEDELKKYNVKDVFKLNSSIKNNDIINGLIYVHKIIDYKCHSEKCNIKGEWLGNPIELLLIHKNNKENDNRIANLTYNCYNCYFQNNGNNTLFKKVKKEKILGCKICGFNLSKLGHSCKKLGICKICIQKNKTTSKNDGLLLFKDTFTNSLTNEDLEQQDQEDSITINEGMDYSLLLTDDNAYSNTSSGLKTINNKRNENIKKNNMKKHNIKTKYNLHQNTVDFDSIIDMNDINIDDVQDLRSLMN